MKTINRNSKIVISLLMVLVMLFSTVAVTAFANTEDGNDTQEVIATAPTVSDTDWYTFTYIPPMEGANAKLDVQIKADASEYWNIGQEDILVLVTDVLTIAVQYAMDTKLGSYVDLEDLGFELLDASYDFSSLPAGVKDMLKDYAKEVLGVDSLADLEKNLTVDEENGITEQYVKDYKEEIQANIDGFIKEVESTGGGVAAVIGAALQASGATEEEISKVVETVKEVVVDPTTATESTVFTEVMEKIYGEKDAENHTIIPFKVTDNGDGTHYKEQWCCGAVVNAAEEHYGGTATCTELATCRACKASYGELLPHIPAEDDGDCETPITCITCPMVFSVGHIDESGDYICDREGCDGICFESVSTFAELTAAIRNGGYYKLTGDICADTYLNFNNNQYLSYIDLGGYTLYTAGGMHIPLDGVVYLTNGTVCETQEWKSAIYNYGTLTITDCILSCPNYITLNINDGYVTLENTNIRGGVNVSASYKQGTTLVATNNVTIVPNAIFCLGVAENAIATFSFDPTSILDSYYDLTVRNNGDGTWSVMGCYYDPATAQMPMTPIHPSKVPVITDMKIAYNQENYNADTNTLTLNPGESLDLILYGKNLVVDGAKHGIVMGNKEDGPHIVSGTASGAQLDEDGGVRYAFSYEWFVSYYDYFYNMNMIGYSNNWADAEKYVTLNVIISGK